MSMYSERDRERRLKLGSAPRYEGAESEFALDTFLLRHSPAFRRLTGKRQLFPVDESDFFRNRLTHSLEVAGIAKSIATKLNSSGQLAEFGTVDLDLIEFAGLAHDIGHPPFAHKGERTLDELLKDVGGFEGNAQTMRILSRTERGAKKTISRFGVHGGEDKRLGLNPTARSLASILKYDQVVGSEVDGVRITKGYYESEIDIVNWMKECVTGKPGFSENFRTIECSIMDVADDIAYSVFDLEDALHAGFLSVLDLLEGGEDCYAIADEIERKAKRPGSTIKLPPDWSDAKGGESIARKLFALIWPSLNLSDGNGTDYDLGAVKSDDLGGTSTNLRKLLRDGKRLGTNGYTRNDLSIRLLNRFLEGVEFDINPEMPALSEARLKPTIALEVECLKLYMSHVLTRRSRVQVAEHRADHVLTTLFKSISTESRKSVASMLPPDFAGFLKGMSQPSEVTKAEKMLTEDQIGAVYRRVTADFIAGMTDRYAMEFYGRLISEDPQSIFKPI